jgi:hypothetical protein
MVEVLGCFTREAYLDGTFLFWRRKLSGIRLRSFATAEGTHDPELS